MSINTGLPDYELADSAVVTSPHELRAMADPLRTAILDLLLERAATVGELARAVGRPKSTVAHHVNVLLDANMLRVVRTRRVRAIDERYYGRTARVFAVGVLSGPEETTSIFENGLAVASAESAAAHEADDLRTIVRHARIPAARAREFWDRAQALAQEFAELPRSGDTVYGYAVGLYPTDHPALPEPDDHTAGTSRRPAGGRGRGRGRGLPVAEDPDAGADGQER